MTSKNYDNVLDNKNKTMIEALKIGKTINIEITTEPAVVMESLIDVGICEDFFDYENNNKYNVWDDNDHHIFFRITLNKHKKDVKVKVISDYDETEYKGTFPFDIDMVDAFLCWLRSDENQEPRTKV